MQLVDLGSGDVQYLNEQRDICSWLIFQEYRGTHQHFDVTGPNVTDIAAGSGHSCALRSNGQVLCWGSNDHGQLGIGTSSTVGTSAGEMGDNLTAVDLGAG